MKALFIIHCQDPIYGASRSIGNLIRNLDIDVDIIFPIKAKKEGRITAEQIEKFYGNNVKNVWYLPQPARLGIQPEKLKWKHHVKCFVKEFLYILAKPLYSVIYHKGAYDFIHLNSITLFPMLNKRWPMFLHVRESVRESQSFWNRRLGKRMEQAHGIIYISEEDRARCPNNFVPGITLVNPYDQTAVSQVNYDAAMQRFGLSKADTIYAIIGNIFPCKGVDFVIKAYQKAKLENSALLIVGRDTNHDGYEEQAKALAKGNPTIRFLGEIQDVETIYRVTDYVIRGDAVTGAGRTTFESLYSGGGAILTGNPQENLASLNLPPQMEERVFFYPVRSEEGLILALRETQSRKYINREYKTNVPDYITIFMDFINENSK